jgi:hypothetical protein
MNNFK